MTQANTTRPTQVGYITRAYDFNVSRILITFLHFNLDCVKSIRSVNVQMN
jgi:hypothetical protein